MSRERAVGTTTAEEAAGARADRGDRAPLFAARRFEGVTVAEIAREADVAEKTVFNYFPTKEDLFYSRLEAFEEELLEAVRTRAVGESVLHAFSRFLLAPRGVFARLEGDDSDTARERLRTMTRVVSESPALLARERQVFDRYTESLAEVIAQESGAAVDDVEPSVAASALFGVHRALIDRRPPSNPRRRRRPHAARPRPPRPGEARLPAARSRSR